MASQFDIEVALATLDLLTARLKGNITKGGFDNNSVMWLIKAWTKVGIRLRGSNYHREASTYYIMKRDPSPSTNKRSRTLLSALESLESIISRNGTTSGDFFTRADKAMLDFVWEYRKSVGGLGTQSKTEQDFVSQLTMWKSTSSDQAEKAITTGVERHA